MPVHLLERNGPEQRFRSVRELDHADLASPALHLYFSDPEHPVVMFAPVGRVHTDFTEMIESQALNHLDWKSQLRRAEID